MYVVQTPEHIKITDFGLTKILNVGETTFKSARGKVPVRWLAPECLRYRLYTHKSDVWSYGEYTIKLRMSMLLEVLYLTVNCNANKN